MLREDRLRGLIFRRKRKENSEGNWSYVLTDQGTVPQGFSRAGGW